MNNSAINHRDWTTKHQSALNKLNTLLQQEDDPDFFKILSLVQDEEGLSDHDAYLVGVNSRYPASAELWKDMFKSNNPKDIWPLGVNENGSDVDDSEKIEVPRSATVGNKGVTKAIEDYIFDILAARPEEPFHTKDLFTMARRKFSGQYGDDLLPHTAWALNMLAFNKLAKKVAPGTWESYDGPDDEIERSGGYAPEGEFARRSYRVYGPITPQQRQEFKHSTDKAETSVKMLKTSGMSKDQILSALTAEKGFHPVAVKIAVKKYFQIG